MNTPITDLNAESASYYQGTIISVVPESIARRLETDRALLIEALEKIAALPWDYNLLMDAGWVMRDIRITLTTVRANFPTP